MSIKVYPASGRFAGIYLAWRNEPKTILHNPISAMSLQESRNQLEAEGKSLELLWETKSFRWFVEWDGVLAGNFGLKRIDKISQTAEISYGVGQAFQGRGIAKKMVEILNQKIFTETPIRKLIAYVHDQNTASRMVLKANGYTEEGILKEHFLINGQPQTEIICGLLRKDWSPK